MLDQGRLTEGGQMISLIPENMQKLDSFLLTTMIRLIELFSQVWFETGKREMCLSMNIGDTSKYVLLFKELI